MISNEEDVGGWARLGNHRWRVNKRWLGEEMCRYNRLSVPMSVTGACVQYIHSLILIQWRECAPGRSVMRLRGCILSVCFVERIKMAVTDDVPDGNVQQQPSCSPQFVSHTFTVSFWFTIYVNIIAVVYFVWDSVVFMWLTETARNCRLYCVCHLMVCSRELEWDE